MVSISINSVDDKSVEVMNLLLQNVIHSRPTFSTAAYCPPVCIVILLFIAAKSLCVMLYLLFIYALFISHFFVDKG